MHQPHTTSRQTRKERTTETVSDVRFGPWLKLDEHASCKEISIDIMGHLLLGTVQGGKSAAETILDMRVTGDFSKKSTKEYQRRWNSLFGYDFKNVSRFAHHRTVNPRDKCSDQLDQIQEHRCLTTFSLYIQCSTSSSTQNPESLLKRLQQSSCQDLRWRIIHQIQGRNLRCNKDIA